MKSKIFAVILAAVLALASSAAVSAQFAVSHPSVEIIACDAELKQQPGTATTYKATVKNTGDVALDKVYLTVSFLPSRWYEIKGYVRLDVGQTADLTYELSPPSDAFGAISFDLIANAERGFGIVDRGSKRVTLSTVATTTTVIPSATTTTMQTTAVTTTTTTGSTTTQTQTTQVQTQTQSSYYPISYNIADYTNLPERAFRKIVRDPLGLVLGIIILLVILIILWPK